MLTVAAILGIVGAVTAVAGFVSNEVYKDYTKQAQEIELENLEYEHSSALSAQEYQQDLALKQYEMQNTYQDQVADMKAAGLNVGAIGASSSSSSTSSGSSLGSSSGKSSTGNSLNVGSDPSSALALSAMAQTAADNPNQFYRNINKSAYQLATNVKQSLRQSDLDSQATTNSKS